MPQHPVPHREPHHEPLLRRLEPVRRRLFAIRLIRRAAAGLLAGSSAALAALAAARFLPVPEAPTIAAAIALTGLAAGAAAALRPRIDVRTAARVMDGAGTDDALVTALDMLHLDTPVARLQRADAEAAAARFAAVLGERLPWPGGRERRLYMAGLAAVWLAAAVLLIVPNPMEERLAAGAALGDEIGKIERALDELDRTAGLSERDRKALTEPLSRLREQALRKDAEALRADWEAAEREMARLASELHEERQALRAWAQELQRSPGLEALGRALERGGRQHVAAALEETRDRFARLTPEQREALAERLRDLAGSVPDALGGELREALERAAEAIGEGEEEAAAEALKEALEEALSAEELQELAEQAAAALASAGSRLGMVSGSGSGGGWNGIAAAGEGSAGASDGGSKGSDGGSAGRQDEGRSGDGSAGQGGGTGRIDSASGEAADVGSVAGAGSGGAGSEGAGGGSGSGSGSGSGAGSGSGGASGSGAGFGSGGRTLVTTPRVYAGEGEVTTDGGPVSGGAVTEGGRSPVFDGGVRDYAEVYASYEADARRALSGGSLPPALKARVKNYFDEIQPDR